MSKATQPPLPPIDGYIPDDIDDIPAWGREAVENYAKAALRASLAAWCRLPNAEVLKIAPMMGDFNADEVVAFCAGFRRCAQAVTEEFGGEVSDA